MAEVATHTYAADPGELGHILGCQRIVGPGERTDDQLHRLGREALGERRCRPAHPEEDLINLNLVEIVTDAERSPPLGVLAEAGDELVLRERLDQVVQRSEVHAVLDRGNVPRGGEDEAIHRALFPQPGEQLRAEPVGQVDVEENELGLEIHVHLERPCARLCSTDDGETTGRFHEALMDLGDTKVVFHDQDGRLVRHRPTPLFG